MAFLTSASRLLASALLLCVASGAGADEADKSTQDQIKAAVDALKQQKQTPANNYTVNQGSLAIESWLLTSTAIDSTASNIHCAIQEAIRTRRSMDGQVAEPVVDPKAVASAGQTKIPVPPKILIVGGAEAVEFGQAAMLKTEIEALQSRLASVCNCAQPGGITRSLWVSGGGIDLAASVLSLLKSETTLDAIQQSVDPKLLAAAVASKFQSGEAEPILPAAAIGAVNGGALFASFETLVHTADVAQAAFDRADEKTPEGKALKERLKPLLDRYSKLYDRATSANEKGVVPLVSAARLFEMIKDNPYVLRVNTEQAGGTLLKRTNLWTALGSESAFVSGGLVSSYQLTDPSDGRLIAAGVITCRTVLTSLKHVQQGSWGEKHGGKYDAKAVCLPD